MMIRVDFTPRALKIPTDPRTESITRITPERPSNTYNIELYNQIVIAIKKIYLNDIKLKFNSLVVMKCQGGERIKIKEKGKGRCFYTKVPWNFTLDEIKKEEGWGVSPKVRDI